MDAPPDPFNPKTWPRHMVRLAIALGVVSTWTMALLLLMGQFAHRTPAPDDGYELNLNHTMIYMNGPEALLMWVSGVLLVSTVLAYLIAFNDLRRQGRRPRQPPKEEVSR